MHWLRTREGSFRPSTSLPISDRGFRYGMAVFETIGVRRGELLFLAEHLRRGLEACEASDFHVGETWFRQAGDFLHSNLPSAASGVARIHVTAGDGPPGGPADQCRMLLSFEPRAPIPSETYAHGYRVSFCPVPFSPTLGGRKTHNYWPNAAALQEAQLAGSNEGLAFTPQGELISACMANVFVVLKEGRLVTPPLGSGARDGVVRAWVLRQRDVRETSIERSDLRQAREIFLTSSWLGIMPVGRLEGTTYRARDVTGTLMIKYQC